jgi:hypothetical protein
MRHGAEKSSHAWSIGKLPTMDQPAQLIERLSIPHHADGQRNYSE